MTQLAASAASAPKTAHAFAYESLRDQILSGQLKPGTALVQANLANELGISMTPVREALRSLASEGLVTASAHRGAVVSTLDIDDAREIHWIRLQLEPEAVRLAVPRATPELLDRIEALIDAMDTVTGPDWIRDNFELHSLLISAADSPRLLGILRVLQDAAQRYLGFALTHRHDSPAPQVEHRRILECFRRRDVEGAVAAITDHIRSSLASFDEGESPAVS
jgi:DNA-binding GntR family transcriptional regulator